jgi:cyclin B
VRKIINRNNNNISITKEESKNNSNNNYSFLSKTQFHYDIKSLQKENNISSNRNPEEEYLFDILYNLLKEEKEMKIKIDSSYFKIQPEINEKMRAILIDWLIDVNNKFCFKEETLLIAINIIDTYLSLKKIERCNLQLLGITALFIACKQNEIIFRRLNEYAYITDNAYNVEDILSMEKNILKTLDFNILFPSALTFYEILCNKFNIIDNKKENKEDNLKFNLGQFLIQSFYMSSNSLKYYASHIACSVAYIVMKFFKMKNYQVFYDTSLFNTKEKNDNINNIKECAKDIYLFVGDLENHNLNASIRNFSSEKYGNISKLVFGNLTIN